MHLFSEVIFLETWFRHINKRYKMLAVWKRSRWRRWLLRALDPMLKVPGYPAQANQALHYCGR